MCANKEGKRGGGGEAERGEGVKPGQCGGQDFFPPIFPDFGQRFLFDILPNLSVCYLVLSPNLSVASSSFYTVRSQHFLITENQTGGAITALRRSKIAQCSLSSESDAFP